MGWHRGGFYTARWVDRLLFGQTGPAPPSWFPASSTAHPAPPGFVVEQVHPPQLLVLHSNSFVPDAWRARLGGLVDFSWTWRFALADTGEGGTRLLRTLGHGQGHGG